MGFAAKNARDGDGDGASLAEASEAKRKTKRTSRGASLAGRRQAMARFAGVRSIGAAQHDAVCGGDGGLRPGLGDKSHKRKGAANKARLTLLSGGDMTRAGYEVDLEAQRYIIGLSRSLLIMDEKTNAKCYQVPAFVCRPSAF